jgi:uncharacterized protein YwgA
MLYKLVEAAGGEIDGRKKLHKLAYLCQRAGTDLGQGFVFHMYGVYSPSLSHDVELAAAWHYLRETVEPGASQYEISLGQEKPDEQSLHAVTDQAGFNLVKNLARESASVLEVLTTIVYLWDAGYRDDRLPTKLHDLKGHLSSYFSHASTLAQNYGLTGDKTTEGGL